MTYVQQNLMCLPIWSEINATCSFDGLPVRKSSRLLTSMCALTEKPRSLDSFLMWERKSKRGIISVNSMSDGMSSMTSSFALRFLLSRERQESHLAVWSPFCPLLLVLVRMQKLVSGLLLWQEVHFFEAIKHTGERKQRKRVHFPSLNPHWA